MHDPTARTTANTEPILIRRTLPEDRRAKPIAGSSNTASHGPPYPRANGHVRLSIPASGVCTVNVNEVIVPPGGKLDGFSETVAPSGAPCTPSVIGLAIGAP